MSLKMKILDERLTTVSEVGGFDYFEGENRTLKVQIFDTYDSEPYYVPVGANVELELPKIGTALVKAGTVDSSNRSVVSVELSQTETTEMTSGNLLMNITDGLNVRIAKASFAIRKLSKQTD